MNSIDLIEEIISEIDGMSSIEEVLEYLEERKDELIVKEELTDSYYTDKE